MKTCINIELSQGETLGDAVQQLLGTGERTCACNAEEPKTAPADATEEAPAEKLTPKQKRKAAAARVAAREKAREEKEAQEEAEAEKETEETPAEEAASAADPAGAPSREDVRRAAMAAMNEGKRGDVEDVLKAHGGTLKDVPEAELADVLAEIEAL